MMLNSLQLAKKIWEWIISCSIIPDDEIIVDKLMAYERDYNLPNYVISNARRRVFEHLKRYKKLSVKVTSGDCIPEDVDELHRLHDGIV